MCERRVAGIACDNDSHSEKKNDSGRESSRE